MFSPHLYSHVQIQLRLSHLKPHCPLLVSFIRVTVTDITHLLHHEFIISYYHLTCIVTSHVMIQIHAQLVGEFQSKVSALNHFNSKQMLKLYLSWELAESFVDFPGHREQIAVS